MVVNTRYGRGGKLPPAVQLPEWVTRAIPVHQRARSSLNCYPAYDGLDQSEFRPELSIVPVLWQKEMNLWRLRFGRDIFTFGLISIPVRLFSGARSSGISFHQLHRTDLQRVKQQLICPLENKNTRTQRNR